MDVLIVIPAHNEEAIIEQNVDKVIKFMKNQKDYNWHLVIAENGSKDDTLGILKKLSKKYPKKIFSFKSIPIRSKSDAIKQTWLSYEADIYIHMDADLSTDLSHIPQLVEGIKEGNDIVIGSRGLKTSEVERGAKRNFISYGYNIVTSLLFSLNVKDLQCGFKAINKRTLNEVVKQTKYISEGFMDTEILILAAYKGFRIKEIPIGWKDDRESKFNFLLVGIKFVGNLLKVKRDLTLGRYK